MRGCTVEVSAKGVALAAATLKVRDRLRAALSNNPKFSHIRPRPNPKAGTIEVEGISREELLPHVEKAAAYLRSDVHIPIDCRITEWEHETPEEVVEIAPEGARQKAQFAPVATRPALAGRYTLLLTARVIDSFKHTDLGAAARSRAADALRHLQAGDWEGETSAKNPPVSAWSADGSGRVLFSREVPEVGTFIWERAWSADLFSRMPSMGRFYGEKERTTGLTPHVILREVRPGDHPQDVLVLGGTTYQHADSHDASKFFTEGPRKNAEGVAQDDLPYTEELYRLSRSRINDFLSGDWRGLPIHLSEEQVEALGLDDLTGGGARLLIGEAGSGKTLVLTQWLVMNHLEHLTKSADGPAQLALFPTLSDRLRDHAKESYRTMLPPPRPGSGTDRTVFRTLNEILFDIIGEADAETEELSPTEEDPDSRPASVSAPAAQELTFRKEAECTFERFMREYAPDLQAFNATIDPVLLWDEIRAVIKGSAHDDVDVQGILKIDAYRKLNEERGHCKVPTHQRDLYYEAALKYQAYLDANKLWDSIDITRAALLACAAGRGPRYARIACDEVQDFAPVELKLVLSLRATEDAGLFFSGDDAQVINPSGFDWNGLKSILGPNISAREKSLRANYRSNAEIIDVVNAVLRVRREVLDDEVSQVEQVPRMPRSKWHAKPIILASQPLDAIKQLSARPDLRLILTKNAEDKREVLKALGADAAEKVTVLTIEEAKGLEYEGVLLWKFFQPRSKLVDQDHWSTVFIPPKRRRLRTDIESKKINPYGLTYEFNLLHVGLTRARRLLIVWDGDSENNLTALGPSLRDHLTIGDTDWGRRWETNPGSGEDFWAAARRVDRRDSDQAGRKFALAARRFEEENKPERAAQAWEHAKEYDQAARCYRLANKPVQEQYQLALHWEHVGEPEKAAERHKERAALLLEASEPDAASDGYYEAAKFYGEAAKKDSGREKDLLRLRAESLEDSAHILARDREAQRAARYADAADAFYAAGDLQSAISSLTQALHEANECKPKRISGESNAEWQAARHDRRAHIYTTLSPADNVAAARDFLAAADLWAAAAATSATREKSVRAQKDGILRLIALGNLDAAKREQQRLVEAIPAEMVGYLKDIAEAYLTAPSPDPAHYVHTRIEAANLWAMRKQYTSGISLLRETLEDARAHPALALERVKEGVYNKIVELALKLPPLERAGAYMERARFHVKGHLAGRAKEDFLQAGKNYLLANYGEEAAGAFKEAATYAELSLEPFARGQFSFLEIGIEIYQARDDSLTAWKWAERSARNFALDLEKSVEYLKAFIAQRSAEVAQIKEHPEQQRNDELKSRKRAELRKKACAELAIARTYEERKKDRPGAAELEHRARDAYAAAAKSLSDAEGMQSLLLKDFKKAYDV